MSPGQVVGQRFEIIRPLAHGGFEDVYEARDLRAGVVRALRHVPREALADPAARVRFQAWADKVRRLDHPHLLRAHELVEDASFGVFVVTDLIRGRTVAEVARERGALDVFEALRIASQVAGALACAHEHGLVIANLVPQHVVLEERGGYAVVCDLGLSAVLELERESDSTLTGALLGDLRYASRECLRRDPHVEIDGRADVYSLGTILYELLTGVRFLAEMNEPELIMRVGFSDGWRPVLPLLDALPDELALLIEGSVEPDRDRRVESAAAFAGQLDEILDDLTAEHAPAANAADAVASSPDAASPAAEDETRDEARATPLLDENVQFTVYRPKAIRPATWYRLLAFAHLAERPAADPTAPDPIAEVRAQAERILGSELDAFHSVQQDSRAAVPRGDVLTFVPNVPGIEFNPAQRSFQWLEAVHREEFRLRTIAVPSGQTARGSLTVFLGSLVLAEIALAIRVDSSLPASPGVTSEAASVRPYRKIFASYSHADLPIVQQIERIVRTLGDDYMRDATHLRSGEVWSARLAALIEQADVFQLFWSWNSMNSPFVRKEWEHALALARRHFIRPTYWQEPMPIDPRRDLPPAALRELHFHRLPLDGETVGKSSSPVSATAVPSPLDDDPTQHPQPRRGATQETPTSVEDRPVPVGGAPPRPSPRARAVLKDRAPAPYLGARVGVFAAALTALVACLGIVLVLRSNEDTAPLAARVQAEGAEWSVSALPDVSPGQVVLSQGETPTFRVEAHDAGGASLTYTWKVDGEVRERVTATDSTFTCSSCRLGSDVAAVVEDQEGNRATIEWSIVDPKAAAAPASD